MAKQNGQILTGNAKADALLKGLMMAMDKHGTENFDATVELSKTKKIIIPETMTKLEAAEELKRQYNNEEQFVKAYHSFEGWDWKDVLVAIKLVSEEEFGWIDGIDRRDEPMEIDVMVDVKDGIPVTTKCFYGNFQIAAFEDAVASVGVSYGDVSLGISLKKKYSNQASAYFDKIEKHLRKKSIYRGKTVVVKAGNDFDGGGAIDFEIIENLGSKDVILNEKEEMVVEEFVIGSLAEPGKHCILFTGDYGTGKTETAMRVGRIATRNKMTFFYCKDSKIFESFLNLSKLYQPCVVFMEDVDEIGSGSERTQRMNSILNTLDGVQTKGNNLTVIFTTNNENKINSALRRPGRIDLIVRFSHPDTETKKKIYQHLFSGIDGADALDYDLIVASTPDVQGAVVAEICNRAKKLAAKNGFITEKNVLAAIASMEYQVAFMQKDVEGVSKDKQLLDGLCDRIAKQVDRELNG